MRGAIIIVVLAAWYALLLHDEDGNLSRRHFERAGGETMGDVSQDSPVFALASALEDTRWELKRCPAEPDMVVAGGAGYYVVLEHDWWDVKPDHPAELPGVRATFAQLYLVAEDSLASVPSPDEIVWRELPDMAPRWMRLDGPSESVYMGTVGGYHVFGYMTVPLQEEVRHCLGTSGGDDRLKLLQRQLGQYEFVPAYLKTIRQIVRHGDAALPILRDEIDRLDGPQRQAVIISLMRIPGPESAGMLRTLYQQDDMRDEIAYLMRIGPRRPDLEDIYSEIRAGVVKN
jgi:hypothetical protein